MKKERVKIKDYVWLFEWVVGAIAFGIAVAFMIGIINESETVKQIILIIVGILFLFAGLFRLVPLMRTTKDKFLMVIYVIEVLIFIGCGALLLGFGTGEVKDTLMDGYFFGILIGIAIYFRGLVHFFSTSLRKEKDNWKTFLAHIIFLTVGSIILSHKGFDTKLVGWLLFAILLLCGIVVTIDGINRFKKYRHKYAAIRDSSNITEETGKIDPVNKQKDVPNDSILPEKEDERPQAEIVN